MHLFITRRRSSVRLCCALLAIGACSTTAAATLAVLQPSLPAALQVLQRAGCSVVPEASSARLKELDCRDDRAYFLCGAMQARDTRLDCSIGAGASRLDWEHQDAAAIIVSAAFTATAQAEPCVAWIYPDPGPDKLRYGRLCAARLLDSLGCTAAPDSSAHRSCTAAALPACQALQASSLVEACR